jgi:hypothetical protein
MRTLVAVPLLISLAACGAAGGAGPTKSAATATAPPTSTPTPLAQAAFFPFAVADTWTYSDQPLSGCDPTVETEIHTIASVSRAANGSLTAIDNLSGSAFTGNNPGPETYTVKPDGSVLEGLPANPAVTLYPSADVIRSGQTVPINLGRNNVLSDTAHGAGTASVSVPAGTFMAQLLVVDVTYAGALPVPGLGGTPGPPSVDTATSWLVAGVGLVKQTNPGGSEHGFACMSVMQLVQYHVAS